MSIHRRGCQPPWYHFPELDPILPLCNNVTELKQLINMGNNGDAAYQDWTRPDWSTTGLSIYSKCPVPCTSSTYQ